jgi:hypothetical protein
MKKLPIGIQTFSEIIKSNYCYVDKTPILDRLVNNGKYFFLSRPRRFGKSLFLDTLKEAFSGNRDLFKGLYLEDHWDWSVVHPVIKIDFGGGVHKDPKKLEITIKEYFRELRIKENITIENDTVSGIFRELIVILEKKYSQKVVVLIDEYDKPILDNITDSPLAKQMRDSLRDLYSVIKTSDAHIKFVFITGVSKFSKVNLFSGLNNITDITLDSRYATICGYTESELSVFQERLIDVNREELKLWYNGYNFLGEKVYNPFDILLYLDNKRFKNYWFETGNPTFLIELMEKNQYNPINFERVVVTEEELASFDVDEIKLEVLLFHTGYLTILEERTVLLRTQYILTYPNQEIKLSLTSIILNFLTKSIQNGDREFELHNILLSGDIAQLKPLFHSFFASIPYDWYRKNNLSGYEAYYSAIFYCYFTAIGLDVRPEMKTSIGQIEMVVLLDNKIFVFEFKVIELTEKGSALEQIKKKKYYEKYLGAESPVDIRHAHHQQMGEREIFLIGVEFSKEDRNITNFEWERLK